MPEPPIGLDFNGAPGEGAAHALGSWRHQVKAPPEDVMTTVPPWLRELTERSRRSVMSTAMSPLCESKRRFREVKQFSRGHTVHKQQRRETQTSWAQSSPATGGVCRRLSAGRLRPSDFLIPSFVPSQAL